uniref:NADH dehydrogenase [ubiquinone] flavoprotein 3, mitochondrial n=1 Tax=Ditylenchus dipsaci TaxID=166011 RepID=A0A915DZA3_9BILA
MEKKEILEEYKRRERQRCGQSKCCHCPRMLHRCMTIKSTLTFCKNYAHQLLFSTSSVVGGANELDGAGTSTGIEHALKYNQLGISKYKKDAKDYKCSEYLHFNTYSFYDKEIELQQYRAEQPSNQKPDVEPKLKGFAEPKSEKLPKKY